MYKILIGLIFLALTQLNAADISQDCVFKGKKLYGKVKIVNAFPDFKVQIVNSFPDLKVQQVTSLPDKCGKWQIVDTFADFKIQYVNTSPGL